MFNEEGTQILSIGVDEKAYLSKDSEPDIFGTNGQVVMLVICMAGRIFEAIFRGCYVASLKEVGVEGGLEDAFATTVVFG